jgi:hypothetical protein
MVNWLAEQLRLASWSNSPPRYHSCFLQQAPHRLPAPHGWHRLIPSATCFVDHLRQHPAYPL